MGLVFHRAYPLPIWSFQPGWGEYLFDTVDKLCLLFVKIINVMDPYVITQLDVNY